MTTQEQAQQLAEQESKIYADVQYGDPAKFQSANEIIFHENGKEDFGEGYIKGFLAASAQQGWVSVDEHLPEHYIDVLLCLENNMQIVGHYSENTGYWYAAGERITMNYPIVWQSLPSPPAPTP